MEKLDYLLNYFVSCNTRHLWEIPERPLDEDEWRLQNPPQSFISDPRDDDMEAE